MPSRTDELFRPVWIRPRTGTLWLRHPQLRGHQRAKLTQRGQTAFRYRARKLRRRDYPQLFATGSLRNSCTPSRPFVWTASFVTSSSHREHLGASVALWSKTPRQRRHVHSHSLQLCARIAKFASCHPSTVPYVAAWLLVV